MAAGSKAWVYGRSPAEIVGSNPTGGMDHYLLWVLFVVRRRSLRRADHSSRGLLPTVVRRCVWSRNLVNEETLAHCRVKTISVGREEFILRTEEKRTRFVIILAVDVRGSGGKALLVPNLGTKWVWVVSLTFRPLYTRKEFRCPLNRRLRDPIAGLDFWGIEKVLRSAEIQTPERPPRSLVTAD